MENFEFSPSFKQPDTHPAVMVSWEDAQAFCAWLTRKELAKGKIKAGQKYRLPTDAEWSVAVGLGQEKGNTPGEKQLRIRGVYPWGKEWPPPKRAGNYGKPLKVDKYDYTSPVRSFAANKLGLHDMGGNVHEWCEDWYDPAVQKKRVLRGTSWGDDADGGRDSFSHQLWSSIRVRIPTPSVAVGFRCVLTGE